MIDAKDMEIPAKYFFWIWGVISFTFLKFGLDAIKKTKLSISVSPVVMSLFEFSLIVASGYSFTYAVTFHPRVKISIDKHVIVFMILLNTLVSIAYLNLLIFAVNGFSALFFFFFESHFTIDAIIAIKIIVLALVFIIVFFADKLMFAAGVMLMILSLVSPYWKEDARDKWLQCQYLLPVSVTDPTARIIFIFSKSKVQRWVEFVVGMLGSIVFQNFFRITSFHEVAAFLFFAVSWLANTVLVLVSHDLGVLNFLLGNVIIGCTVSEYGLRGASWIAYGAAVVLYGLRVKLESVEVENRVGQETQVVIK